MNVKEQLAADGYAVIEQAVPEQMLDALRLEAARLEELAADGLAPADTSWAAKNRGCIFQVLPADLPPNSLARTDADAYTALRSSWPCEVAACEYVMSKSFCNLAKQALGGSAYLFNEQYIIKPSRSGASSSFPWHRDSSACKDDTISAPYISVWVALDAMDMQNGALVVLPGSHATPVVEHAAEAAQAEHLGVPLCVPAGTAVVMSSDLLHCSGPNDSLHSRRAWMPQFSAAPIVQRGTGRPMAFAVPVAVQS